MNLSGIMINDTGQYIAYPIDKEFLSWFAFLRKNNLFTGCFFSINVFGTKAAVAVSIRVKCAVVILPDILKIDLSAGLETGVNLLPIRFFLDLLWTKGLWIDKLIYCILCHCSGGFVSQTTRFATGKDIANGCF